MFGPPLGGVVISLFRVDCVVFSSFIFSLGWVLFLVVLLGGIVVPSSFWWCCFPSPPVGGVAFPPFLLWAVLL